MKYLIIAEKPSVATDLSRALSQELGKFQKKGKSRDAQYFTKGPALSMCYTFPSAKFVEPKTIA